MYDGVGVESDTDNPTVLFPCGVCGKRVGSSSTQCDKCGLWHHRRCSGLSKSQIRELARSASSWTCPKCVTSALLQC
jgi:hypothetical protein